MVCSQLPTLETKAPDQYIRKGREDRALKDAGLPRRLVPPGHVAGTLALAGQQGPVSLPR